MGGKADYRPSPGYEDKLHVIGPPGHAVWVGRKGDVPGLLNDRFWEVYRAWQTFHLGLDKPERGSAVADGVMMLEGQYRAHFDERHAVLSRLDAIIKLLGGGRKPVRR
jgi:hypothetical protein